MVLRPGVPGIVDQQIEVKSGDPRLLSDHPGGIVGIADIPRRSDHIEAGLPGTPASAASPRPSDGR